MIRVRRDTAERIADRALLYAGILLPISVAFSNALAECASFVLCVAFVVLVVLRRPHWPVSRSFGWFLGMWLAACLISALLASDPALGLRAFFRKTAEYALVALAMALLARDEARLRLVLITLAWACVVFSVDGIIQWKFGHDLLRWHVPWGHRLTGPLDNPNNYATYLVMVTPIQLWVIFNCQKRWQAAGLLLGVLLSIPALVFTDSRLSWGAFAFSVLVFAVLARRAALLVYPALLLLGLWRWDALRLFSELSPGRAEGWSIAWRMFLDHPIVGIGHGTYMANYMSYLSSAEGSWPRPQYAHNCYLQLLAEGGIMGLGTFLLVVGWVVIRAVRRLSASAVRLCAPLSGLVTSLLVFFLGITFDTGLYSLPIALLFWSLLGLTVGAASRPGDTASPA